jgi:hypothetical protein
MEYTPTPLEERASEFVISLALSAAIMGLIEQDKEIQAARNGGLDLDDPEERALMIEVIAEEKVISQAFLVAGTVLEQEHGISA